MRLPQCLSRFSLSLAGAGLVILTALATPASAATLRVSYSSMWAGNIVVGQSTTLSCTLSNTGPQSVRVASATSNNSAYTVTAPAFPFTLASGQSVKVAIRFAPPSFQRMQGTVVFTSNASNPTVALSLNGWGVQGKVSASLPSASFGSVAVGSSKTLSETLKNVGATSLSISSANTNGSAFARTGISPPVTLAAGASITFKLLFLPKTSGATTGSLTVLSNGTNRTLTIPLSGTGGAAGTLSVSPGSANLGSVAVGSSKTMSATLTASGASVLVSSATTTSSEFTVSGASFPLTIASGKSAAVTVKFSPNSSGTASGKLSFTSSASNAPTVVSLTGTGIATATHEAALAWKSSSSTVSGYNVYRGTHTGGPYSKVNSSLNSGTSYSDTSVQAGQTYYYVVTGVNSSGQESSYSNQAVAAIPTP